MKNAKNTKVQPAKTGTITFQDKYTTTFTETSKGIEYTNHVGTVQNLTKAQANQQIKLNRIKVVYDTVEEVK